MDLIYLLRWTTLIIVFILSVISIREPMNVAKAIVHWVKFVSGGSSYDSVAREAVELMEQDPSAYASKYTQQLGVIRLTGWVGIFVSTVGACILTVTK